MLVQFQEDAMTRKYSVVRSANKKFIEGDFEGALCLYEKASSLFGAEFFHANVTLCKKRLALIPSASNLKQHTSNVTEEEREFFFGIFYLLLLVENEWIKNKIHTATLSISKNNGALTKAKIDYSDYSIEDFLDKCRQEKQKHAVVTLRLWTSVLSNDLDRFVEDISYIVDRDHLSSAFAHELSDAGAYFRGKGRTKDALAALKAASEYLKDEKTMRTLYWAAYKETDLQTANSAISGIRNLGIKRKTSDEWLEKAGSFLIKMKTESFSNIACGLRKKSPRVYKAEPKKIGYVLHNSLPYSSGGYATRGHGMATGLKNNGGNVICVTRPGFPLDIPGDHVGKELPMHDEIDGIKYYRIFEPTRKNKSENGYILEAAKAIENFLIEQKVDIVMVASNNLTAIPAGIAARKLGLPYFYEVRGLWEITRLSREPEFERTARYVDQVRKETEAAIQADGVFTLTTPMLEELVRRGVPAQKITLLPNSCDPSRFTPRSRDLALARDLKIPDNVPVIGYIGSFVQYEGLENLAQACALLLRRGIDFRLLLVGNENASGSERGPITEEIYRIANEEGLSSKLIMPGRVPHEKVEAYYSLIDIAPFPRKPQPVTEMVSPMKPLEALAMEKVVVMSSVRALAEMVVDNETGVVFEKGNVNDLASTLERLLKDPALRQRLGKAGRSWVKKQRTWEKTSSISAQVLRKYMSR